MSDFKVFAEWISVPCFVVESWNQFNPHKAEFLHVLRIVRDREEDDEK